MNILKILGKSLLALAVILAIIYAITVYIVKPVPEHPVFNHDNVLVMAHRGGRGLWPENTMYAFRRAVILGADVLDFDVHYLVDGHFAVIHDDKVDRTTNGSGSVQGYPLPELQTLDAGYNWTEDNGNSYPYRGKGIKIPSLSEVFAEFPRTRMNIEIKQTPPEALSKFCNLIRKYGMDQAVVIASFSVEVMQNFRDVCPGIATAAATREVMYFFILNMVFMGDAYHPDAETVQMPGYRRGSQLLNKRFIETAHDHNMEVYAWTINNVERMQTMIGEGVDGIITDYPDRLIGVLGRDGGEE